MSGWNAWGLMALGLLVFWFLVGFAVVSLVLR
jgi:hypothetical protein